MTDNDKTETKIGIFSFFAGAGFLDLGFETTQGFETVFVNEYHKPFMEVYKASRKGLKINTQYLGIAQTTFVHFLKIKKLKH